MAHPAPSAPVRCLAIGAVAFVAVLGGTAARAQHRVPAAAGSGPAPASAAAAMRPLPLAFVPDANAFVARSGPSTARVTATGSTITSPNRPAPMTIRFVGASARSIAEPTDKLPGHHNYLIGSEAKAWRTHVPTYARVHAPAVYPGIDVEYYGNQEHLEYDFIVRPHADPSVIRIELSGGKTAISRDGALTIDGVPVQRPPVAFQTINGTRQYVDAHYVQDAAGRFKIELGKYDRSHELVIDPVVYLFDLSLNSTYQSSLHIAVDAAGSAYIVGYTDATNLPAESGYQQMEASNGEYWDGFLLKLNPAGTAVVFATYLGGPISGDLLNHVALDSSGYVYVAGWSSDGDFSSTPRPSCGQPARGCPFVAKLSPDGSELIFVSWFEPSDTSFPMLRQAEAIDLAVGPEGTAYLVLRHRFMVACVWSTLQRISPNDGALTEVARLSNPCEVFRQAFTGVAVGNDGVVQLVGYEVRVPGDWQSGPVPKLWRYGPHGSLLSTTVIGDLPNGVTEDVTVGADGRVYVGWRFIGDPAVAVVDNQGGQLHPGIRFVAPPEHYFGPFVGVSSTGVINAVVCKGGTVMENCVNTVIDPSWHVRTSSALVAGTFATDAQGALYGVRHANQVQVRKYTFLGVDAFGPDRAAPHHIGRPFSMAATISAFGGNTPVECLFYRFDNRAGTWTIVQPYGPSCTFNWTPAYDQVGTYELQVWVRPVGSTVAYETWASSVVTIEAAPPPVVTGLTPMHPVPLSVGSAAAWTISATSDPADTRALEYRFYRRDGDAWHLAQDYGPSNVYVWTPGASDVGSHALQAWVRPVGSTAAYEAYAATTFDVRGIGALAVSLSLDQSAIAPGQPLTVRANASGGVGPLQYQFYRRDGTNWFLAQDYSADDTYVYTPRTGDVGAHGLQVWVRNAGSSMTYDAWSGAEFAVETQPLGTPTLSANMQFPVPAMTPIQWTTRAQGGNAPYAYQFWVYREGTGWALGRDYAASPTFDWTPPTAGTYALQAFVRQAGSSAAFDAYAASGLFPVQSGTAARLISLTADRSLPSPRQVPITWTAAATGGTNGPLQFQFLRYDQRTQGWTIAQAYGSSHTFTWTPGPTDGGVFALQVWVRSAGATTLEHWAGTGYFLIR